MRFLPSDISHSSWVKIRVPKSTEVPNTRGLPWCVQEVQSLAAPAAAAELCKSKEELCFCCLSVWMLGCMVKSLTIYYGTVSETPCHGELDGLYCATSWESHSFYFPLLLSQQHPSFTEWESTLRAECKFTWIKMLPCPRDNEEISIMRQTNALES